MSDSVHSYLSSDHERLDELLARSLRSDGSVDLPIYEEFRGGLLRHIGIEEKTLFPLLRRSAADAALVERLHRDHALLSALLVLPPSEGGLREMREVLVEHNRLEEEADGAYERFENLAGDELATLLQRIVEAPQVPLAPHVDKPLVRESIEALRRARRDLLSSQGSPPR